jgi:hypothetical protein
MKYRPTFLMFGMLGVLAGCQCTPGTERLGDAVDHVGDRAIHLDALYRPDWDLNRIGHSDWCESRFNQLWCRRGCCRRCESIVLGAEHHVASPTGEWNAPLPIDEQQMFPPPAPAYDE